MTPRRARRIATRTLAGWAVYALAAALVVWSASSAKRGSGIRAAAAVDVVGGQRAAVLASPAIGGAELRGAETPEERAVEARMLAAGERVFDGRRVRPARVMWMKVTAYSPDARSCGKWADGVTASLKSVWTNGGRLAAADTRILPFGSLITVPGYAGGEVVPVLDRGGAIKGNRLDMLYPTHERARRWGVQRLPVTVWEYVDGG